MLLAALLITYVWYTLNFQGGDSPGADVYRQILSDPVKTTATVTKYHFQRASGHNGNFDRIEYRFEVDGRSVMGKADGAYQEGSQVPITYYKKNPSVHCMGSPSSHLTNMKSGQHFSFFLGTAVAFLFVLLFLIGAFFGGLS